MKKEETKNSGSEENILSRSKRLLPHQIRLKAYLSKYSLSNLINLGDVYEVSALRAQEVCEAIDYAMVAHGLREILEKLPEIIAMKKKPPNFKGEITRLIQEYRTSPSTFLTAFESFVKSFEEDTTKRTDITTILLRILNPTLTPVPEPILLSIIEKWNSFVNNFNAIAHLRKCVLNDEFSKQLENFEFFLLQLFKPQIFNDFEKLDELIENGHSFLSNNQKIDPTLLSQIFSCISNTISGASLDYFFSKLQTAKWIPFLLSQKKTLFKIPPQVVEMEDGSTFHPKWSQSQYLARVAEQDPHVICKLLLEAENTDNLHVQEDYVNAALKMPTKEAAEIAKIIIARDWLKKDYTSVLPSKCADLAYMLAEAKRFGVAKSLFENLLLISPSIQPTPETKASPYICEFIYAEILRQKVPKLVKLWGLQAFQFVETLLAKCLQVERLDQSAETDCSYIWHAMLQSDFPQPLYLSSYLIKVLRDAGIKCLEQDLQLADQIIIPLLANQSGVFNRLGLHIASQIQELPISLIDQIVRNEKYYQPISTWGEFADFLKVHFHKASEHIKNTVFPDIIEAMHDGSPKGKKQQLQILTIIKLDLPFSLENKFESLREEFGDQQYVDRLFYESPTLVGPTSPVSFHNLRNQSVTEIITFLQTWIPSDGWFAPSREGLGRELSEVVKDNPNQFLSQDYVKMKIHPIYCRAILEGLKNSIELFSWEKVLELCHKLLVYCREEKDISVNDENQIPYSSLQIDIARLLQKALTCGNLHLDLRHTIWLLLEQLVAHTPLVPPEQEIAEKTAYNILWMYTARGETLQNVILYAKWVKENAKILSTAQMESYCPEAKKILELQLQIASVPQISLHAIYGQYLPTLIWLDQKWAHSLLGLIFPKDSSFQEYRYAAWSSYITCCHPTAFDKLEDLYREHILFFSHPQDFFKNFHDKAEEEQKLCQHLILLYIQGHISLESTENLLSLFFDLASPELQGFAIRYTGQILKNSNVVTELMIERLQNLWDTLISQKLKTEELRYFGWWALSPHFDAKWILERVIEVVERCGNIDPESLIFEALQSKVSLVPEQGLSFAELYVKRTLKSERFFSHQSDFYNLLKVLKLHLNEDQRVRLEDLIHLLGSGGYSSFRPLLKTRIQ